MNVIPLVTILMVFVISVFFGGYAASVLWDWFIVPLGVTPITYLHAVGIICLFNVILGNRGLSNVNEEFIVVSMFKSISFAVGIPLLSLTIGWLVK